MIDQPSSDPTPAAAGPIPAIEAALARRRLLVDEWDSYRRNVMPAAVSSTQLLETRRAFYAGARALLTLLTAGVEASDGPPSADELTYAETLEHELTFFMQLIQRGQA